MYLTILLHGAEFVTIVCFKIIKPKNNNLLVLHMFFGSWYISILLATEVFHQQGE